MYKAALGLLALTGLSACTVVNATESCVETRYGKVVNEHMDNGMNSTIFTHANCFQTTQQNYPTGKDTYHAFSVSTHDPVVVTGKVHVQYHYAEIPKLYLEKRTEDNAEVQMISALNTGITNATARFTMDELFGPQRAVFADSIKAIAQKNAGPYIIFDAIYLTDLAPPAVIAEARIATAKKETELQAAQRQLTIDSVNAAATVLTAKGNAEKARLEAQAIASSPDVLKLRAAQAMAEGLSKACSGATTCIIGGTVLDRWMAIGGGMKQ